MASRQDLQGLTGTFFARSYRIGSIPPGLL
jgi:hypothetical protein